MTNPADTPSATPALFSALLAAQRSANALAHDKKNEFHKYTYASSEALIDEGRAALADAKLSLLTGGTRLETRRLPRFVTSKDKSVEMGPDEVVVIVAYSLVHESGEAFTWTRETPVIEERGRPLDKAVAGALTTSLGYALRDLLLIPRSDRLAADMNQRDDRNHPAPKQDIDQADASERAQRMSGDQPYLTESEAKPANAGGAYGTILGLIREDVSRVTVQTIKDAKLSKDATNALGLIREAYLATSDAEFADVGGKVREVLPEPAVPAVLEEVKAAWKAHAAKAKAAA